MVFLAEDLLAPPAVILFFVSIVMSGEYRADNLRGFRSEAKPFSAGLFGRIGQVGSIHGTLRRKDSCRLTHSYCFVIGVELDLLSWQKQPVPYKWQTK
jgi:hypothetical protein